jgi:quinol monooxygenase YgiN
MSLRARHQRPPAAQFEEIIMSKNALYIRHQAKPGKRDEVKRVWEKYARDYVGGAKGQLTYFYGYDDKDPDAIVVFAVQADQAAAQDFVKQPWFADYESETRELLAGPSEFRTATPQWTKAA